MVGAHALILFIPAMLAITFAPGPDMLFVLAQSARGGARRGLIAVAGIISGGTVHIGAAAIGLSALLVRSALLFSIVKYAGAAYLVYLGLHTLLARERTAAAASPQAPGAARHSASGPFVQGFITNVLNPKVALFVLAFLPQFVEPARGHVGLQIAELGSIWYATAAVAFSFVALAGGAFDAWRRRNPLAQRVERYVTGTIFVALGARVALP
ncbi:MAG: LysE family translocator [Candidatus Baltobacteraceae bacterium]|jgi:threonine/homoserine/homoserine lactone efflux protein